MTNSSPTFGRAVIYTNKEIIDSSNVVEVLDKAFRVHTVNASEIDTLYGYYKGNQPILNRTKKYNEDICNNKIVVNRANEIVSFKVGYLMGEPVQYVNRTGDDTVSEAISTLNEYVFAEDKEAKDKELAEWFTICGTAYRMVLPDKEDSLDEDSPLKIYTLDPRYTFVVYWSGLGNKPVMGVKFIVQKEGIVFSVYTDTEYFEILDGKIIKREQHRFGFCPIIEYPANNSRLGAFEICTSLLDAINEAESNRLDGIEQFIQALLVLKGVDIEDDGFRKLKEYGGIKCPADGDVKYLVQELNQTSTQVLVDDLYQTVLTICGMPNRNGGTSTSDTGSAVVLRDGWSSAETRAKDTELMFKKSEKVFLKLALRIIRDTRDINLKISDIEIRFTRRNYENIQEKSNVLISMLSNNKIHPRLAFEHSGMFVDPELAYDMSIKYYDEQMKKLEEEMLTNAEEGGESSNGTEESEESEETEV